jgi:MFS family permease
MIKAIISNILSNKETSLTQAQPALLSLFILTLGNGLLNTLTTVRLEALGVDHTTIGVISSVFYAGIVLGAFLTEPYLIKIGYIKAYSSITSLLAITSIIQGLHFSLISWAVIRFISGCCIAGIFIIIESHLVNLSKENNRGKILSIYMVSLYLSQALGQQLLKIDVAQQTDLFAISSFFTVISIIPISITTTIDHKIKNKPKLNIINIFNYSALGTITCLIGGALQGSVNLIFPAFLHDINYTLSEIANIMFVTILGGMVLQYPIGYSLDRLPKKNIILIVAFLTLANSYALSYFVFSTYKNIFMLLSFLLGGLSFSIYTIGISIATENLNKENSTSIVKGMLLSYSIGATVGPLTAPYFNFIFGKSGLLAFFCTISAILAITSRYLMAQQPSHNHKVFHYE